MTFSQEAKSEILKSVKSIKGCCASSFLTAVLKAIGSLTLERRKFFFTAQSENYDFLATCQNLSVKYVNCNADIKGGNATVKGDPLYVCSFENNIGDKLGLSRHEDGSFLLLDDAEALIPKKECCKRAFAQGLFLSAGSVVIPTDDIYDEDNKNPAKYHLELRFTDMQFAQAVQRAYSALDMRLIQRKTHAVLYLKDSEKIADFLSYAQATRCRFKLDNIIAGRSMRNKVNRQNNCSVANIDKTVSAAQKQLNAIALLRKRGAFDSLPRPLKDIALLREQNHEATLDEIAVILKISKSGANHRFAKLIELANLEENK